MQQTLFLLLLSDFFFYNFLLLHVFEYTIMIWGYYVHVHAGDGLELRDGLVTERAAVVAGF